MAKIMILALKMGKSIFENYVLLSDAVDELRAIGREDAIDALREIYFEDALTDYPDIDW